MAINELRLTGAPLLMTELAESLCHDFDTTVYYNGDDGPLRERLEAAGVQVTKELNVADFDVTLANTILAHDAVAACLSHGVPTVWAIHESDPAYFKAPSSVAKMLPKVHSTIFACEETASVYAQFCPNSKIIPSLVKPFDLKDRISCRKSLGVENDFVVVNVGTIEKRKGQRDLVEAVRGLNVKCFLVGRLADPSEIAGAGDNVTHVDITGEVHSFYAAADLYVNCSRIESFPRCIIEAACYRVPIIATPVFGVRSMMRDGVHGLFYRYGRPGELRDKIMRLIGGPHQFEPLPLPTFQEMVNQYRTALLAAAGLI